MFEELYIKIYQCMKGDIDRREGIFEAEVNITFHKPINHDIGLFKHQLLFCFFSVSSVRLILSKTRRSAILNLELPNISCCHPVLYTYWFDGQYHLSHTDKSRYWALKTLVISHFGIEGLDWVMIALK